MQSSSKDIENQQSESLAGLRKRRASLLPVPRPLHLFFDLDGTLTDSADGIIACIQHALACLNQRTPSADEIRPLIGSPLRAIFGGFLPDANDQDDGNEKSDGEVLALRAIEFYRDRFDTKGFSENRVYAGIPEVLGALRDNGHRLFVVTSKPSVYAEKIKTNLI